MDKQKVNISVYCSGFDAICNMLAVTSNSILNCFHRMVLPPRARPSHYMTIFLKKKAFLKLLLQLRLLKMCSECNPRLCFFKVLLKRNYKKLHWCFKLGVLRGNSVCDYNNGVTHIWLLFSHHADLLNIFQHYLPTALWDEIVTSQT